MNSLTLAYIGDAIYELYIRKYLINKNIVKINDLQKEAVKYVSAKAQSSFINKLIENNILTEEEIDVYKRARNHKQNHKPKNTDIVTYKNATGLEAIIGYLYLNNKNDRIDVIMKYIEGEVC